MTAEASSSEEKTGKLDANTVFTCFLVGSNETATRTECSICPKTVCRFNESMSPEDFQAGIYVLILHQANL